MSRKCELTGVRVQFGNNVSHSQRRTRRSFCPNVKKIRCHSEITHQEYNLKITTSCLRNIEKAGGFDSFMLKAKDDTMSDRARSIQKTIKKIKNKLSA